jgi:GntR family transcriptional regulator/MocR family aminotransferase
MRRQLTEQLRQAVRDGRLPAGSALPSTRALAFRLGVSRGVVSDAYEQLVSEGYLVARQGAATRVRPLPPAAAPRPPAVSRQRTTLYDLVGTSPDLSIFPRRQWLAAVRHVTQGLPDDELGYPKDPRGAEALRFPLASYLARVRGISADHDQVLITQGFTQGLALTCRVLARRGARRIGIENPSDNDQWETVHRNGLEPVAISVDEDGLDVDQLEGLNPDAVLVTAAHQFPTGAVLAPARRVKLAAWAHRNDRIVIEDDYDYAYRYDRDPVGTLQGLAPQNVVHIGSVSKLLAPGLRLGWAVAPRALAGELATERFAHDSGHQAIDQHAFAHFLTSGELDRHLRRSRQIYRGRRDKLIETLTARIDGGSVEGIAAGLHFVFRLPADVSEAALVRKLATRRVRARGLAEYYLRSPAPAESGPGLVLGFGRLPEPAVPAVVELLVQALAAARKASET